MSRLDDPTSRYAYTSVIVAGTVMLSCAGPAQAGYWENYKEFRNLNPGIDAQALRALYKQHYGPRKDGPGPITILPIYPPSGGGSGAPPIHGLPTTHNTVNAHMTAQRLMRSNRSFQMNEGQLVGMGRGADIDLASSEHNIKLGDKLFKGADSVQIKVGDSFKTLTVGSQVTASEYLAAKQVLSGQGQQLQIDKFGKSEGGAVDFGTISFKNDRLKIDDLNIPVNVTAFGDFGRNPIFQVSGDLVNAGTIYASSSSDHARRSNFAADNITNQEGASITTDLPSIHTTGFAENSNPVDLNLRANDKVSNYGNIYSSGDLTIDAGNQVRNGKDASLWAGGNVEVSAPRIENAGTIGSNHGDVTLDSHLNGELNVINSGGTVIAREGAINIRNDAYAGTYNTYVTGGNLYSKEVNVNAGRGSAEIDVDDMTGTLNQKGAASHVFANTDTLTIGNICLTGDPTYSNAGGNIVLDGSITVGETLNIIASGNITNSTALTITANDATQGFDVNIIAGADITAGGATTNLGPIVPPPPAGTLTTISGTASVTGGNVNLGQINGLVNINTRSASKTTGNGGNVLIAAYQGTGGGNINLGGSITTGGRGASSNGNVTMIAGGSLGASSSSISSINTTGGTGGGGDISFSSVQPAGGATYNANGSITGSLPTATGTASTVSLLTVNGSLIAAGDVALQTPSALNWLAASKFSITAGKLGTIDLAADSISVNNGNFFSSNTLNINLGNGSLGQGGFVALQTNAINIVANGDLATSEIVIVSNNSGLVLFNGSANIVNFGSTGTFMTNPGLPPITGTDVLVGSFSAGTGLNLANPVEVDAVNLFITAGKGGDVFAHNNHVGVTTLLDTTTMIAKNTFSLTSDDDLAMLPTAVITAPNVSLSTVTQFNALNGTINAKVGVSLTSAASMTNAQIPATINTARLTLTSTGGDIGASDPNEYLVNTGVAAIVASAATGSVFLQGPAGLKSFEVAGGSAANLYSYVGPSSLVISGATITSLGADATFVIDTGTLSTKKGVATTINSGNNILLQVLDNVSTQIKILLAPDTTLQTKANAGFGDITLALGTPITQVVGTPPAKGVSSFASPGFQIFWGTAGISGKGTDNNVVAQDADVTFSNAISSKNINLGGNVLIYADPPGVATGGGVVGGSSGELSSRVSAGFGEVFEPGANHRLLTITSLDAPSPTTLDLSSTIDGALPDSSLSALQQSTINIITAEQATAADSLMSVGSDDSYFISSGPSASIYAGAICSDDETYGAITTGGTTNDVILKNVSHTALSERVSAPEGKTLFVPSKDVTIETQFGDIHVNGGAVVLISTNDNGIAIYNVHDSSKNSVSIDVRGRKMNLCPGRHMLVTSDSGSDFASVNHVESVQHRGVSSSAIADLKVHTSEFSTLSAMAGVLPLRAIFESKHPHSRKLADKMLKTTAVLMYLSSNQGDFQYFVKPRMTALR